MFKMRISATWNHILTLLLLQVRTVSRG